MFVHAHIISPPYLPYFAFTLSSLVIRGVIATPVLLITTIYSVWFSKSSRMVALAGNLLELLPKYGVHAKAPNPAEAEECINRAKMIMMQMTKATMLFFIFFRFFIL